MLRCRVSLRWQFLPPNILTLSPSLLAVFLRNLEYYRGIIFLTTNRLGTIDVAFQSRVCLAVRYNLLTPELCSQLWLNFIDRLNPSESEVKAELLDVLMISRSGNSTEGRSATSSAWRSLSLWPERSGVARCGFLTSRALPTRRSSSKTTLTRTIEILG